MDNNSSVFVLNEKNFTREVLNSRGLVLVQFNAVWSGDCRIVASTINKLSAEFEGSFKLGIVDVDRNQWLARKYRIQTLPTILFFHNGIVVDQILGVFSAKKMTDKLLMLLESQDEEPDTAGR